jgi:hypothetical protein
MRCSGIDAPSIWSGGFSECGCIFGWSDQFAIFCRCKWHRCCADIDIVGVIPDWFEVDAVGLKKCWEITVVACSLVVLGGACIAVVCVVFSAFSPSTCCGVMVGHFAVCAFVYTASVSSAGSSSATLSTTMFAMTAATMSVAVV